MPKAREFEVDVGDTAIAVREWPGRGRPILLLHATGFHSRCWNEVVRRLHHRQVYAADLRFHGDSGSQGEVSWSVMSEDIRRLIEALELRELIGVGHSIGGYLMARAAAALPCRFHHLLLIDPVILPPAIYREAPRIAGTAPQDHPVSRRRNRWQDADEMYRRFRDRKPFDTWQDQILRDYCDYALKPAGEDGLLQLACDPINEAAVYVNQGGNEVIHEELAQIETPVHLLRAAPAEAAIMDLSRSPTWPGLADALPNCRETYLPEMSHFIPMEDPQLVADCILAADREAD